MKFNKAWHSNSMEGVVNARCLIFEIGALRATQWKIEILQNLGLW